MDYRFDKLHKEITTSDSVFMYEKSPLRFKAAYMNFLYAASGGKLVYSKNTGKTWQDTTAPIFGTMHITSNFIVYGFTQNPTKLYKSTNFVDFSEVNLSEFGLIDQVNWYNCDSNGNVFIFSEKNTLQNTTVAGNSFARIFRTADGGATWNVVHSPNIGHGEEGKIGHWHSLDYLGGAPIYGVPEIWIATSGDHNKNVRWYKSEDNGSTWSEIEGVGEQKFRTLKINRVSDKLIWSTDALPSTANGIYQCDLNDVTSTTELVHPTALTSYGAIVRAKGICTTEREGSFAVDGSVQLYATKDSGRTWQLDLEIPIRDVPVNHSQPGIHEVFGPDKFGNYYMNTSALDFSGLGSGSGSSIIARNKQYDNLI